MDWILALSIISGQLIKLPFGLGGITIIDLAVFFILLANLSLLRFKLKKPPLFVKAGLVFLAICAISLTLTPLHLTFTEYLNSFSYSIRWALYLLLGWVVFSKSDSKINTNFFNVLEISGVSLAILGIIQLLVLPDFRFLENSGWDPHYFRAVSTFLDPNFLGAYLVLTLLALRRKLFFVLVYAALLLTFSRSSYLMFLTSFLTLSFLKRSKKMLILTFTLFGGLMLGFYIYTLFITTPRGIDRKASASYRLGTWQQGLKIFEKSPVLGVGFNSYRYAVREYKLGDSQFLNARGSTTNDFSLLYVLATTGILGLVAFLLFIGAIFFTSKNKLILSFLPGILLHSIFNNSLFYPFILIWIMLLAARV